MLLEVRHLHVAYGDAPAVWDASLEIGAGQIVAVVGPNGAGKSTLINAIAGMLRPRQGRITIDGVDVTQIPGHRVCDHGVAIVPEGRRLFTQMTVQDNLELGAYLRKDKIKQSEYDRIFALFPVLKDRMKQNSGTLSGGEQQMLAISRALMSKPQVLLLDEPSLGLAPQMVQTIFRVIREINAEGTTILLVEQNAHMALVTAHRGYVMATGRIVLADETQALLASDRIKKAYLGG